MRAREAHAAWFATLGEPLGEGERADIAAYLEGLGLPPRLEVLAVSGWPQAAGICRQPSQAWWQAEEAERARLAKRARLDPAEPAWLALVEALHGAAALAAARARAADAALIRVAAGAAIYAAHDYRLACAADAGEAHPFARKHALFCGGRWPLGVYGERFAIF